MRVKKHLESLLTESEIIEAKKDAKQIQKSMDSLRLSISKEVKEILKTVSFNELKKQLGISSRTLSKLSKGEGNVTIETISLLSQISHKTPMIKWK